MTIADIVKKMKKDGYILSEMNDTERAIDWFAAFEYVATEPTISVGSEVANPLYSTGEEPTTNLIHGLIGTNF